MARSLQDQLAALSAVDSTQPAGVKALRAALRRRSSHLVAHAASTIGRAGLEGFDVDLLSAMARFYKDPVRSDPGCSAKLALLTALDTLDHPDTEPFLKAACHVQLEPAWGPPVDTASALRARAVRAIGRQHSDDALLVLGSALADPDPPVRRAAVDSILQRGDVAGAALLAMRVRLDDDDPVVRAECLSALVRLAPEHGLRTILPMLESQDGLEQELAALALGESRHPRALEALIGWLDRRILSSERAVGIAAIGAHRSEAARVVLLELIEEASHGDACLAAEALARQGAPQSLVLEAAEDRPELTSAIWAVFDELG